MGISTEVWLFIIANSLTFVGTIIYAVSRFAKLENDVLHIKREVDDILEMKQLVYRIHAQNDVILGVRLANSGNQSVTDL